MSSYVTSGKERPHTGRKLSVAPCHGFIFSMKYETELGAESGNEIVSVFRELGVLWDTLV